MCVPMPALMHGILCVMSHFDLTYLPNFLYISRAQLEAILVA